MNVLEDTSSPSNGTQTAPNASPDLPVSTASDKDEQCFDSGQMATPTDTDEEMTFESQHSDGAQGDEPERQQEEPEEATQKLAAEVEDVEPYHPTNEHNDVVPDNSTAMEQNDESSDNVGENWRGADGVHQEDGVDPNVVNCQSWKLANITFTRLPLGLQMDEADPPLKCSSGEEYLLQVEAVRCRVQLCILVRSFAIAYFFSRKYVRQVAKQALFGGVPVGSFLVAVGNRSLADMTVAAAKRLLKSRVKSDLPKLRMTFAMVTENEDQAQAQSSSDVNTGSSGAVISTTREEEERVERVEPLEQEEQAKAHADAAVNVTDDISAAAALRSTDSHDAVDAQSPPRTTPPKAHTPPSTQKIIAQGIGRSCMLLLPSVATPHALRADLAGMPSLSYKKPEAVRTPEQEAARRIRAQLALNISQSSNTDQAEVKAAEADRSTQSASTVASETEGETSGQTRQNDTTTNKTQNTWSSKKPTPLHEEVERLEILLKGRGIPRSERRKLRVRLGQLRRDIALLVRRCSACDVFLPLALFDTVAFILPLVGRAPLYSRETAATRGRRRATTST